MFCSRRVTKLGMLTNDLVFKLIELTTIIVVMEPHYGTTCTFSSMCEPNNAMFDNSIHENGWNSMFEKFGIINWHCSLLQEVCFDCNPFNRNGWVYQDNTKFEPKPNHYIYLSRERERAITNSFLKSRCTYSFILDALRLP